MLKTENLPPSCVDCLEIRGVSNFWSAKGLSRPELGQLSNFYLFACNGDGATRTRNALTKKSNILLLTAAITS